MPRTNILTSLTLIFAVCAMLWGCGTGYVEGWRDHEALSKEERCNRVDGRQWNGSACVTDKEFALNQTSKGQCIQRADTVWYKDQCQLIKRLDESACAANEGLRWTGLVCMTEAQYACEQEPNKVYAEGECRERAAPPSK